MDFLFRHFFSFVVLISCVVAVDSPAAIAPFTERPRIDFDVVYKELAAHGSWEKSAIYQWVFVPKASADWKPYQNGQWVYSNAGWLWRGQEPWSWVTDHYGAWVYDAGKWKWQPGTKWNASSVLWQEAGDLIGWRPVRINDFQEVIDEMEDLRIPATWSVTLRTNLEHPIDASLMVKDDMRDVFLLKADASYHLFKSYREIERAGPEPAKIWIRKAEPPIIYEIFTLPTATTQAPPNAPVKNIYMYRPVFAQDQDGIMRRIKVNVEGRTTSDKSSVGQVLIGLSDAEKAKLEKIKKMKNEKLDSSVEAVSTNENSLSAEPLPSSDSPPTAPPEKSNILPDHRR